MSKKKTIDQLLAEAKAAEERAKKLRAEAKEKTEAEEKKKNAEYIKELKAIAEKGYKIPVEDLLKYISSEKQVAYFHEVGWRTVDGIQAQVKDN